MIMSFFNRAEYCRSVIGWGLVWVTLADSSSVFAEDPASARMVILAVASSESYQPGLPVLKYPEIDLQRFTEAMISMAGVPAAQVIVVNDGNLKVIRAGFDRAAKLIESLSSSPDKSKFIFYFSGHSDSKGLHFSDGMLERDEFHKLIGGVTADSKVALLDSCYSGALAAKGVKTAGEFSIPKAQYDEPSGAVFLAATSASEQAFEIDELKGSLFTHHLTAGLYGLADANQDGLITVDELYQHVYMQVNLNSLGLPDSLQQKPEYSSRLSGRGSLVMSFVKKKTTEVRIDPKISGEVTFSAIGGVQMFRIYKAQNEEKTLRLIPGNYEVIVREGDLLGQTRLLVSTDHVAYVKHDSVVFREVPNLKSVAKGGRGDHFFGGRLASHIGSMWKPAPHLEAYWSSQGVRLPIGTWRFSSILGLHKSQVVYDRPGKQSQKGENSAVSWIVGGAGDYDIFDILNGLSLTSFFGAGVDFVTYDWESPQPEDRSFDTFMPKVVIGIGQSYLRKDGSSLELAFRREWLFATEKKTDDVLSFSASLFLIGYHF